MPLWLALIFFIVGYVAAYFNLLQQLYSTITDIPSTHHKKTILAAFVSLSVAYLLLLIPLERVADRESRKVSEHSIVYIHGYSISYTPCLQIVCRKEI